MKSCIEKLKTLLLKHYQWGVILLVISAILTYFWKPVIFYPQKTGVVENIEEAISRHNRGFRGGIKSYEIKILIFTIDGEKYGITKTDKNYNMLLGNTITYRFDTRQDTKYIQNTKYIEEIIYNGKVITENHNNKFIFWLVIFILSLCWCGWVLVVRDTK